MEPSSLAPVDGVLTLEGLLDSRWPTVEVKRVLFEAGGYSPWPLQWQAHLAVDADQDQESQAVLVIGGERAGKSTVASWEALACVLFCRLIFLAGESYENTEPEFRLLLRGLRRLGLLADSSTPARGQWQARAVNGCELRSVSFARDGEDALIATGRAPDVVLLCEAGLLDYSHFLAAVGRVAERRGLVLASGTLKDAKAWYGDTYRAFQGPNPFNGRAVSVPSWANLAVYPGGESDPAIAQLRAAYDDQTFRERFGAEPVPSSLLVFGRQFSHQAHVKPLEYIPALPVEVAVDPGYAGAYAVEVVQWTGPAEVRVIDEFYRQHATWDEALEWLRSLPYGERVVGGVGDVAIRQHHGDRSQYEQWQSRGITLRSRVVGILEGIARMRDFLRSPFTGTPRVAIDPRCKGLIWELASGERYDRDQEGKPMKEKPVDRSNHGRKALSYWLIDRFGRRDVTERRDPYEPEDYWGPVR